MEPKWATRIAQPRNGFSVGIGEEQKILGDVDWRMNDEFKGMGKIRIQLDEEIIAKSAWKRSAKQQKKEYELEAMSKLQKGNEREHVVNLQLEPRGRIVEKKERELKLEAVVGLESKKIGQEAARAEGGEETILLVSKEELEIQFHQ